MINLDLDLAGLKSAFAQTNRVQVPGFLDANVALNALISLEQEVEWSFAIREDNEDKLYSSAAWDNIAIERRQEILRAGNRRASTNFQYMFDYYPLMSNYHAAINQGSYATVLAQFIASEEFLSFVHELTGMSEITTVDAQATRYRAGQYLTHHDDHAIKQRKIAYVLNLTKAWHPDWGGCSPSAPMAQI